MRFYTLAAARYYLNSHAPDFRKKLRVVKCRHWSMDKWDFVPCYTVVMK
jgi:hypothetical protein